MPAAKKPKRKPAKSLADKKPAPADMTGRTAFMTAIERAYKMGAAAGGAALGASDLIEMLNVKAQPEHARTLIAAYRAGAAHG